MKRPPDSVPNLRFERLRLDEAPWNELARFNDRTVYQTYEWLNFVSETQNAEPVLASIREEVTTVGYFWGLIVRRFGVRILGSPFPGWTTLYMGFNLKPGISRSAVLRGLGSFAFRDLGCLHVEMSDRNFNFEDAAGTGFKCRAAFTYETDLTASEDDLFARMSPDCRNKIRKAQKSGVHIEEAADLDFAADYYSQLLEVFARQKIVPTYGRSRVEKLIEHLLPTGCLLLLRALDAAGKCIATGIYVGLNRTVVFWGNASHRSSLGANEALHWYAMLYWKKRGVQVLDWGGGGDYKEKYGVSAVVVPTFARSRFPILETLRNGAKRAFEFRQKALGRLPARPGSRLSTV
jgi:hypothetical protein